MCVYSLLTFSPLPNFDLNTAVMEDGAEENQLPSLKEIYVGFSDMVSMGRALVQTRILEHFAFAGVVVIVELVYRAARLCAGARQPRQRGGDLHQLALPDGAALSVLRYQPQDSRRWSSEFCFVFSLKTIEKRKV